MGKLPPQLGDHGCTRTRLLDFSVRDPNTIKSDRYTPQYHLTSNHSIKKSKLALYHTRSSTDMFPLTCILGCLQQILGAYTYSLLLIITSTFHFLLSNFKIISVLFSISFLKFHLLDVVFQIKINRTNQIKSFKFCSKFNLSPI